MLIDSIRADLLASRKAHNTIATAVLSTLVAEAVAVGKSKGNRASTDQEVIAVVKKFSDGIKEASGAAQSKGDAESVARFAIELSSISVYLPVQLTEDEITTAITNHISSGVTSIGPLMAALRAQFPGQYDGAVAQRIARGLLV